MPVISVREIECQRDRDIDTERQTDRDVGRGKWGGGGGGGAGGDFATVTEVASVTVVRSDRYQCTQLEGRVSPYSPPTRSLTASIDLSAKTALGSLSGC